jgi:hypothetical protein
MIATIVALVLVGPPTAEPMPEESKLPGSEPAPAPEPMRGIASPPIEAPPPPPPPPPPLETEKPVVEPTEARKVRAPRAIRWRLDPFLETGTTTIVDPGYRAFDAGRNLWHISPGFRIDARVRGPLFIGTGVRYGYAQTRRAPYDGALATKLAMHELQLILRLSIVLREGIDLVGQVDGGPSFRRVHVDSMQRSTETRSIGGTFAARGGLSLYLPKAWLSAKGAARVTAGVDLLFGSTMRTPLRAQPRPAGASDDITLVGTPIGDATVSGFTWSLAVFLRFM